MNVFSSINDSPNGNHTSGRKLDPRLAWSEGWANFFASAVLNDPLYVDTGVTDGKQDALVLHNLDVIPKYPYPYVHGYWDEHTVGSTLWALFDSRPNRPAGHLGLGFRPIWDVVSGPLKERRHVTLIDFCDLLVERNPKLAKDVTAVLAAQNIKYHAGKVPSVDNPYHRPLVFGKANEGVVDSQRGATYFHLKTSAIYTFELAKKATVKIDMEITDSETPESADLDLYLYQKRDEIGRSNATNGVGGTELIEKTLEPGMYYLEVRSWQRGSGSYRLKATVK